MWKNITNHILVSFLQANKIETFATKMGISKIAKAATACLLLNYVHAVLTGVLSSAKAFRRVPMIGGHVVLASVLAARFSKLDPNSIPSIKRYYKYIWDLFYLEYFLYALI